MERYLPKFSSSIPDSQRIEFLRAIQNRIERGELSQSDVDLRRINIDVNTSNLPMTVVPDLEDKMKSIVYNEFMQSIFVDLRSVYRESNISSFAISKNEMINKDLVAIIRGRLDRITARINGINAMAEERLTSARFENFSDFHRSVFDGTEISADGSLTLAPIGDETNTYNTGADIQSIEKQIFPTAVNVDAVPHPDQDLLYDYSDAPTAKRDLRASANTNRQMLAAGIGNNYWRETILADQPLVHFIELERFDGVVVIITINFTRSRDINSIIIDPFTDRNLEIFKVRYRDTKSRYRTSTFYDNSKVHARSNRRIHLKNIQDIIRTDSIEIWFYQRNFTKKNLLIDGNKYYEDRIWNDMLAREYSDIASRYSPGELTKNARDYTIDKLTQSREYDRAINLFLAKADPDAVTRDVLNLDDKEDVELDRVEYTLGAYSINPQTVLYPGSDPGVYVSHRSDEGYLADIRPVTDIQLSATYETPALTSIEFYIEDEESRVQIPIVPREADIWRQYIDATGASAASGDFGFITFETMFPVISGSLTTFKNGQNIDDLLNPSLVQIDSSGSLSTVFEATGVVIKPNDIFVVEYSINHDNRVYASQRRASVITVRDSVPSTLVVDSTVDDTIHIRENVLTLSRFPYTVAGECNTDINSFPFTIDSVPLAQFNQIGRGDQRILDVEGFIPYMRIDMDPWPARIWNLWGIYHVTGLFKLQFTTTVDVAHSSATIETPFEAGPDGVEVRRPLTLVGGDQDLVGECRIDWSNITWNSANYFNVFLNDQLYDPPTLPDAVKYPTRYGKGAVIRPEVMSGILVGTDLTNPLNTLKGIFASTQCPVLVAIDEIIAEDKTNYQSFTQDPLEPYEKTGIFQYFISGNRIYMNANMEDVGLDSRIDVLYWHLTKSVRMRTILRANERFVSKFTPVVHDYTLKFRSQ